MRIVILSALAVIILSAGVLAAKEYVADGKGKGALYGQPAANKASGLPGAASGGCAKGGGCCSAPTAQGAGISPEMKNAIIKDVIDYYSATGGSREGVTGELKDLGSSLEVTLLKSGKSVKKYSLRNGYIDEI